jgi:hypothetical protein
MQDPPASGTCVKYVVALWLLCPLVVVCSGRQGMASCQCCVLTQLHQQALCKLALLCPLLRVDSLTQRVHNHLRCPGAAKVAVCDSQMMVLGKPQDSGVTAALQGAAHLKHPRQ